MTLTTRARGLTLALVSAGALLLTGCGSTPEQPAYYSDKSSLVAGPIPIAAAQLAERFRKGGGEKAIQGMDAGTKEEGVPRVKVWSSDTRSDAAHFGTLRPAIEKYLKDKEGFEASGGYLLDIYGGEGKLLHRFDGRTS
jgi:hypothetical protein